MEINSMFLILSTINLVLPHSMCTYINNFFIYFRITVFTKDPLYMNMILPPVSAHVMVSGNAQYLSILFMIFSMDF